MILAGDIGGTNTRLALFEERDGKPFLREKKTYSSGAHISLEQIIQDFRREFPSPVTRASIGIAGPVRNQRCEATNLPWIVDARDLAPVLGNVPVQLINDLEAMAHGIPALAPDDFEVIHQGAPGARGNACIVSLGTGLGQAGMLWSGQRYEPFPSEGGHSSFAPATEIQMELLRYLHRQFQHVSWERVLSGQGLLNLYHFLRDTRGGDEPEWLREEIRGGDPAAAISRAALAGKSVLCEQALDLLVALCGQECGNVALKFLSAGGVYLGGGIPAKILPRLRTNTFLSGFLAKGRMRPVLEAIPVRVILNDQAGLIGAAVRGTQMEQPHGAVSQP